MKASSGFSHTTRTGHPARPAALQLALLVFSLLLTIPACSQVTSPVSSTPNPGGDLMVTPPPVGILAYPTETRTEARSNYLSVDANFRTAYIDNLYAGVAGEKLSETTYSIVPTFAVNRTTPRGHSTLSFSPGFTMYEPTSLLNEMDENGTMIYEFLLTPHSRISLNDRFMNSSTSFTPAMLAAGGTVAGTTQLVTPGIIAPFAQRLTNSANGEFTLQTSRDSMIGVSGMASTLHYGQVSEMGGLYDSRTLSGLGFYSRRVLGTQYLGVMYEEAQITAYPTVGESVTRLETASPFYTVYLKPTLSLSISGGPQRYRLTQTSSPQASAWEATGAASLGWQGRNTSFAVSYSHGVTAGGGLLGAFRSNSANASARWQIARTWTTGASAAYAISTPVAPWMVGVLSGGHSVSGDATVEHTIGQQLEIGFDYTRLHQSYTGVTAVSSNPDSNRGAAYISWHFIRPWGR